MTLGHDRPFRRFYDPNIDNGIRLNFARVSMLRDLYLMEVSPTREALKERLVQDAGDAHRFSGGAGILDEIACKTASDRRLSNVAKARRFPTIDALPSLTFTESKVI